MKTILSLLFALTLFSCANNEQKTNTKKEIFFDKNMGNAAYEEKFDMINDSTAVVKKYYMFRGFYESDTIIIDTIRIR